MIRLFTSNETNFNHNKWILSECTSAIVTENIDAIFDLDLEYPLIDSKGISKYLVKGNIIKCPISTTDIRGEQLFVIRTRTPDTSNKRVTIYAQCIARSDLGERNFVLGVEIPAGKTRKEATQILLNGCVEQKGEYTGTLDTNTNTAINLGLDDTTGSVINYLDIAYVKPLEGLLGNTQSIQYAYGGEIVYNNKEINFVDARGSDHNFIISSSKNLQNLKQEISDIDSETFATALVMCSSDGIYLPNNEIIYSSNASVLGNYYKKITCDDVTAVDNTTEALNIVYAQLRERAQKQFNNGLDKLPCTNTINFIQLANTEEYKDYAILEKCEIGNNVTVKYSNAGIEATGRVTEIKFNPLLNDSKGRISEVTIGDRKKSITDTITSTSNAVDTVTETTAENTKAIKNTKKSVSDLTVTMQKSDTEILLEVHNNKDDADTKIEIMDKSIQARVLTTDYNAEIDILEGSIETKVEKAQFGSYITQHYNEIVQAIIDATGSHQFVLNGDGATVKNGGFKIQGSNGNTVFDIDSDGVVNMLATGITDLDISNTVKGSMFYNTLANMNEISCGELKPSRLTILQSDFYINNGYTLKEYINAVIAGTE